MTRRKQPPRKASAPFRDAGTENKQPQRKSKRLEELRLSKEAGRNRGGQIAGHQHNITQKRTQLRGDPPTKRQKTDTRRPKTVKAKGEGRPRTPTPDLIEHWTRYNQWPDSIFEPEDMAGSKKPQSNRVASLLTGASGGSELASNSNSRRVVYKQKNFPDLLKKGGDGIHCFMHDDEQEADGKFGPTEASQELCHELESTQHKLPSDPVFLDDTRFRSKLRKVIDGSEKEIIGALGTLACPPILDCALPYDKLFQCMDQTWINQPSLIRELPAPRPDYCAGYSSKAFTKDQLVRLDKAVGNKPRINPLRDMYFPFLTCEAKSYAEKIVFADRQNAHSMMLSIYALLDLFRGARREQSLHREILGFSVSYDHELVHVYGHYPVISDGTVDIFQTEVCAMRFSPKELGNRWKSWNFVQNIYGIWAPKHLERLCAAIDNLAPDWGVDDPEIGPTPMSQSADLLQDLQVEDQAEDQVEGEGSEKSDATIKPNDGRKTRKPKNQTRPAATTERQRPTRKRRRKSE